MADRTGELGAEVKILNAEFMPLVGECHEQARERGAPVWGMLALGLSFASAEEIGSIIESVEPAEGNEVHDQEFIDCVRQSAFTIELPLPKQGGRHQKTITIPFERDAG